MDIEFFRSLKPGDHFSYNYENKAPEEYVIVGKNANLSVRAYSLASGRAGIFWYNDPKVVPIEIPKHHELYTEPYDESLALAEEERAVALTEGYDPSLDLGPVEEATEEEENDQINPTKEAFDKTADWAAEQTRDKTYGGVGVVTTFSANFGKIVARWPSSVIRLKGVNLSEDVELQWRWYPNDYGAGCLSFQFETVAGYDRSGLARYAVIPIHALSSKEASFEGLLAALRTGVSHGTISEKALKKLPSEAHFAGMQRFYDDLMRRLDPRVAHHELYTTDISDYAEARSKPSPVYKAYAAAKIKGARNPKKEALMLKLCTEASPPGTITYDVNYLLMYARDVIKGRWPEAEPLIIRWTPSAIAYAKDILKERWPELEEKIVANFPPEELERQKQIHNERHCDPVWYAQQVMQIPEEEAVKDVFSPAFQEHGFDFGKVAHHELYTSGYAEAIAPKQELAVKQEDWYAAEEWAKHNHKRLGLFYDKQISQISLDSTQEYWMEHPGPEGFPALNPELMSIIFSLAEQWKETAYLDRIVFAPGEGIVDPRRIEIDWRADRGESAPPASLEELIEKSEPFPAFMARLEKFPGRAEKFPAFAEAYEALYRTIFPSVKHHELYTSDEPGYAESTRYELYGDARGRDEAIMARLKEEIKGIQPDEEIPTTRAKIDNTLATLQGKFSTEGPSYLYNQGNWIKLGEETLSVDFIRELPNTNRCHESRLVVYFKDFETDPRIDFTGLHFFTEAGKGIPDANGSASGLPETFEKFIEIGGINRQINLNFLRRSPVYAPLREAYEMLYNGLVKAVAHHELYGDVSGYAESRALAENESLNLSGWQKERLLDELLKTGVFRKDDYSLEEKRVEVSGHWEKGTGRVAAIMRLSFHKEPNEGIYVTYAYGPRQGRHFPGYYMLTGRWYPINAVPEVADPQNWAHAPKTYRVGLGRGYTHLWQLALKAIEAAIKIGHHELYGDVSSYAEAVADPEGVDLSGYSIEELHEIGRRFAAKGPRYTFSADNNIDTKAYGKAQHWIKLDARPESTAWGVVEVIVYDKESPRAGVLIRVVAGVRNSESELFPNQGVPREIPEFLIPDHAGIGIAEFDAAYQEILAAFVSVKHHELYTSDETGYAESKTPSEVIKEDLRISEETEEDDIRVYSKDLWLHAVETFLSDPRGLSAEKKYGNSLSLHTRRGIELSFIGSTGGDKVRFDIIRLDPDDRESKIDRFDLRLSPDTPPPPTLKAYLENETLIVAPGTVGFEKAIAMGGSMFNHLNRHKAKAFAEADPQYPELAQAYRRFLGLLIAPKHHELYTTDVSDYAEAVELITVNDLKPDMQVRLGKKFNNQLVTIKRISRDGKAFTVYFNFENGEPGWHIMDPRLGYDWQIVGPTKHHELYTDVEPYAEATEAERLDITHLCDNQKGYYRLADLLGQAGFKADIEEVSGDLVLRAHKEIGEKPGYYGMSFLIAPATFHVRPSFYDGEKSMEFVDRSLVLKRVPAELPYRIMVPRLTVDYSPHYDPDECLPEFNKIYTEFLEVITSPVAHHELFGDHYGYAESRAVEENIGKEPLTRAEFEELKPGDAIYFKKRDTGETFLWHVIAQRAKDVFRFETTTKDGKPMQATFAFVSASPDGEWYPDVIPAHHELYTDVSGYAEAVEADTAIEEALGAYTGPKFNRERWLPLCEEMREEFGGHLLIRIDPGERTVMALTDKDSGISFNRGASHSDELIQISIVCRVISPEFSVHLYGDEVTPENVPRTVEELVNFHDAYFVGGPDTQNRSMGRPEPGEIEDFLRFFRIDQETHYLESFYEAFINGLFAAPRHHELYTEPYAESIKEARPTFHLGLKVGEHERINDLYQAGRERLRAAGFHTIGYLDVEGRSTYIQVPFEHRTSWTFEPFNKQITYRNSDTIMVFEYPGDDAPPSLEELTEINTKYLSDYNQKLINTALGGGHSPVGFLDYDRLYKLIYGTVRHHELYTEPYEEARTVGFGPGKENWIATEVRELQLGDRVRFTNPRTDNFNLEGRVTAIPLVITLDNGRVMHCEHASPEQELSLEVIHVKHHEIYTDVDPSYTESLLKEEVKEEERYYGVATGDGNSGVSRMHPDYIVRTDKPWDLADLAAFAAFKDEPAIQEWVGKNMEIDGDADYGISVVFPESMEYQAEREAAQEEYEKRREEAEAAGEEFEEEDPSEEFSENTSWFIIEIFPIPDSEIDDYRCDVYDSREHPDFLDPLYPIVRHHELYTSEEPYAEARRETRDLSTLRPEDFPGLEKKLNQLPGVTTGLYAGAALYIYFYKTLNLQFRLDLDPAKDPVKHNLYVEVYRDEDGRTLTWAKYSLANVPAEFPLRKNMGAEYALFKETYAKILNILVSGGVPKHHELYTEPYEEALEYSPAGPGLSREEFNALAPGDLVIYHYEQAGINIELEIKEKYPRNNQQALGYTFDATETDSGRMVVLRPFQRSFLTIKPSVKHHELYTEPYEEAIMLRLKENEEEPDYEAIVKRLEAIPQVVISAYHVGAIVFIVALVRQAGASEIKVRIGRRYDPGIDITWYPEEKIGPQEPLHLPGKLIHVPKLEDFPNFETIQEHLPVPDEYRGPWDRVYRIMTGAPPGHHELYTEPYEEAVRIGRRLNYRDWKRLLPDDQVIFKNHTNGLTYNWTIVKANPSKEDIAKLDPMDRFYPQGGVWFLATREENPERIVLLNFHGDWYFPNPIKHHELYTEPYEESISEAGSKIGSAWIDSHPGKSKYDFEGIDFDDLAKRLDAIDEVELQAYQFYTGFSLPPIIIRYNQPNQFTFSTAGEHLSVRIGRHTSDHGVDVFWYPNNDEAWQDKGSWSNIHEFPTFDELLAAGLKVPEEFFREAWQKVYAVVTGAPPPHHELYTTGYEESRGPKSDVDPKTGKTWIRLSHPEFLKLKPGDPVIIREPWETEIYFEEKTFAKHWQNIERNPNVGEVNENPGHPIFWGYFGYWKIPPKHHELYTEPYEESVAGDETIMRSLKEAKEVRVDSYAIERAIEWARESYSPNLSIGYGPRRVIYLSFCHPEDLGTTFKLRPSAKLRFQFLTLPNAEESLNSIIAEYLGPAKYVGGGGEAGIGIIDIVEGYPVPATWEEVEKEILNKYGKKDGKFIYALRRLKFFPQIKEAFEGFMAKLFAPVPHYELYTTDVSGYAEGIQKGLSLEQFNKLKKGDIVNYQGFDEETQWTITRRKTGGKSVFTRIYYLAQRQNPEFPSHILKIRFYDHDRENMSFPPPKHHELYTTDTGYAESTLRESILEYHIDELKAIAKKAQKAFPRYTISLDHGAVSTWISVDMPSLTSNRGDFFPEDNEVYIGFAFKSGKENAAFSVSPFLLDIKFYYRSGKEEDESWRVIKKDLDLKEEEAPRSLAEFFGAKPAVVPDDIFTLAEEVYGFLIRELYGAVKHHELYTSDISGYAESQ